MKTRFSGISKIICIQTSLLLLLVGSWADLFGQAASVTWPLSSNGNPTVVGSVTATSMANGTGVGTVTYASGTYVSTRTYNQSSLATAISGNDYLQFAASPAAGNNLSITSISFGRAVSGGTLSISVLFSLDPNFGSYSIVGSTSFNNSTISITSYSGLTFDINNGQTLYVRIYGWGLGTSNYFRTNNVVISGTTTSLACGGTPTPGNTNSTGNPVCSGELFTLSLQNATQGTGLAYQWQSSGDGSAWNNLSSANVTIINSDFSSQPSGSTLYGSASVSGGELILTPVTGGLSGGFLIQTSPGANITPFSATFDYRIWDGTGADGLSLSYGPNMAEDAGGGEAGEGTGVRLCFDTYDNVASQTNSQVLVYYGGNVVWNNPVGFFNLRNSTYRNVNITVTDGGYLSCSIGGAMIISNLFLSGYASADKTNWKFKFSGRTGGLTDKHSIDNLLIKIGDGSTLTTSQSSTTYYRCRVTCSGNTGSSTPLQVNIKPTFNTTYSDVSCFNGNNGTITVINVSGGSGSYLYSIYNGAEGTYQESNIFEGLTHGTYKVRVKDTSGCESPACPD